MIKNIDKKFIIKFKQKEKTRWKEKQTIIVVT